MKFKLYHIWSWGIIAKPSSENIKVIIGPRKNNQKLACVGDTYSFKISFKASATLEGKIAQLFAVLSILKYPYPYIYT
jgi:hypothetical protein